MGKFDTIFLDVKCPYCDNISKIDLQTKDLFNNFNYWNKGDFIGKRITKKVLCIGDCWSEKCSSYYKHDYENADIHCRFFDIEVFIRRGIITGEYKILQNIRTKLKK